MFISGRISINVIRPDTNILVYLILIFIVNHKLFYMFGVGLGSGKNFPLLATIFKF